MLRNALFIARADLRGSLRHRETWIWTFVMPIVFFYFFSTIQGGRQSTDEHKDELTLVVPDRGGLLVDALEQRLAAKDYEVQRVTALDPAAERPERVVFVPERFSERVLAGRRPRAARARAPRGRQSG
jgi:ABC-type Na+ efflux pump permease subunit